MTQSTTSFAITTPESAARLTRDTLPKDSECSVRVVRVNGLVIRLEFLVERRKSIASSNESSHPDSTEVESNLAMNQRLLPLKEDELEGKDDWFPIEFGGDAGGE